MPSIKCKDVGMDCDFEATADTEDELMKKIAEHAAEVHDMKTIPPEVIEKVKRAMKWRNKPFQSVRLGILV